MTIDGWVIIIVLGWIFADAIALAILVFFLGVGVVAQMAIDTIRK